MYFGALANMAFALGLFMAMVQPGSLFTDGSIFSAVALKDLHGGQLYLNAWENKPPGIYYLIEGFLLLIPNPVYAVYALAVCAFLSIAACQFYIIYRQTESFGLSLIIAFIASYYTVYKNNIAEGLMTEIYGTACVMIALAAYTHYTQHKQFKLLLLGAVSIGGSIWFKEPFALLYVCVLLLFITKTKQHTQRLQLFLASLIPTVFCIIMLWIDTDANGNRALEGFIDAVKYNFNYLQTDQAIAYKTKLNSLYEHFIRYGIGMLFLMLYMSIKLIRQKGALIDVILMWSIVVSAGFIFWSSPYDFGHYYFPFFALFYIGFALLYGQFNRLYKGSLTLTVGLLGLFQMYAIDKTPLKLNYELQTYQEDNIVKTLKKHPNKTLFVDYVNKGDYYLKSGLNYTTFLPLALQVHFNESPQGLKNRERIWKELSQDKPDFLITTHTTSYFSWFLPDPDFYKSNYTKVDSVIKVDENPVYLWQLK